MRPFRDTRPPIPTFWPFISAQLLKFYFTEAQWTPIVFGPCNPSLNNTLPCLVKHEGRVQEALTPPTHFVLSLNSYKKQPKHHSDSFLAMKMLSIASKPDSWPLTCLPGLLPWSWLQILLRHHSVPTGRHRRTGEQCSSQPVMPWRFMAPAPLRCL